MWPDRALDDRYLMLEYSLAIRVNWCVKTVQIMVHRPSVLDHLQRGEARHLALEEEVPAVQGVSEGVRRM